MKYLLWAVVIYIAWRWYVASKRSAARPASSAEPERSSAPKSDAVEAMVKCAQCGIHLPHSEAVHGPGAITFCSEAHQATHRDGSL